MSLVFFILNQDAIAIRTMDHFKLSIFINVYWSNLGGQDLRLRVAGVAAVGHEEDEDGPLVALLLVPLGELTTCSRHFKHFKKNTFLKVRWI